MSDSERFRKGATIPLWTQFSPGADAQLYAFRTSNGEYFNGGIYQATRISVPMTQMDPINLENYWHYNFETSLGNPVDNYIFEMVDEVPGNSPPKKKQFAYVGGYLDTLEEKVARILGLSHENIVILPSGYDSNNQPTSGVAKVYNTAANALANSALGLTDLYNIVSVFDSQGKLISFTQTRFGS